MVDLGIPGYDDAEKIGRGGFATVYRAGRQRFGDFVAIKLIDTVPDERMLRRVDRELQALGKVAGHRNIVTVHDAGRRSVDGRPYIVMELVPGGTLAGRARRHTPLPWPEVAEIGVVLANALQWAHDRGVIHRDLKPENVLVDDRFAEIRDRIRLSDFGVAAIEGRTLTSEAWSLAHAAPEVILDGAAPTIRGDLYGLASTLYELLDGEPPFFSDDDETLDQIFARIQAGAIRDLRGKGVPDPVASVIEQGLQREPDQRPESAAAVATLLRAAAADVAKAAEAAEGAVTASAATREPTTRRQEVTPLPRPLLAGATQPSSRDDQSLGISGTPQDPQPPLPPPSVPYRSHPSLPSAPPPARPSAWTVPRTETSRGLVPAALLVFLVLLVVGASVLTLRGGSGNEPTRTTLQSEPAVTSSIPAQSSTPAGLRRPVELPQLAAGASLKGDTPCPPTDGSAARTTSFEKPPPLCVNLAKAYIAEIRTTKGLMVVDLDVNAATKTVNNFVVLARYKYYDGIAFHRIIPGFVIQGGDPLQTGTGGPGYKFEDELPKSGSYKVGSVAMANSAPNTNGSQFFIVTGSTGTRLPPQYSLFGQVTQGLEVVKAIEEIGIPGTQDGKPSEVVKINSVTIKET